MSGYTVRPGRKFGLMMLVCILMQLPSLYLGQIWGALGAGVLLGLWIATHIYGGIADSYRDMAQRSLNAYKVYQDDN